MVSRICEKRFAASGSWTAPAGISNLNILACGGGGGGGAGRTGAGNVTGYIKSSGGGGAGSLSRVEYVVVIPGQVYTITIGAGGPGGIYAVSYDGTNGNPTTISGNFVVNGTPGAATYTFIGGSGGKGAAASPGIGGSRGGLPIAGTWRTNAVDITDLMLAGYNAIACTSWDQQPQAGGNGYIQANTIVDFISAVQSDGIGSWSGSPGGSAGATGNTSGGTHLGGGGGGGGGGGPFRNSFGGDGGHGGAGNSAGVAFDGANGTNGLGPGAGGGGGGTAGASTAGTGDGGSGGSGVDGILYLRWVE